MGRILVVDDSEDDRLFERALLEDRGHELLYAEDGEHALETYRTHDVDLVVTDLHMPHLNGLQLVKELRALDPKAVIIAVSGVAKDQLDLAHDLGAVYTLFKPIEPPAFLECVRKALEGAGGPDVWAGHDL